MGGVAASLVKDILHIKGLQSSSGGGSSGGRGSKAQKVAGKVGRNVEQTPGLGLLNMINKRVAIPLRLVGLVDPGKDMVELALGIHDLTLDHSTHGVVVSDRLEELGEGGGGLGVVESLVGVVEDNLDVLDSGHRRPERAKVEPDVDEHDEGGGSQEDPGVLLQQVRENKELRPGLLGALCWCNLAHLGFGNGVDLVDGCCGGRR